MKRLQRLTATLTSILIISVFAGTGLTGIVKGASWNRIEPLKSRRADVINILGPAVSESAQGVLRFNVSGGSVQVSFVDAKFVTTKKLSPELEGTVLQIILQHDHSSDTPESMDLLKNRQFVRDNRQGVSIFRNSKEGLIYTFIEGTLKTTRYTFADGQLHGRR
jgi:hypothetical protein